MTTDPYPDLSGGDLLGAATVGGGDDVEPARRPELDEADSRLLDALSQPDPPVVTAVEDQPLTLRTAPDDRTAALPASGGRGPLTPVFREPTG